MTQCYNLSIFKKISPHFTINFLQCVFSYSFPKIDQLLLPPLQFFVLMFLSLSPSLGFLKRSSYCLLYSTYYSIHCGCISVYFYIQSHWDSWTNRKLHRDSSGMTTPREKKINTTTNAYPPTKHRLWNFRKPHRFDCMDINRVPWS